MKKYIFKPGWLASVCVLLLLPLFIGLGVWQGQRAKEKQALMDARARRQQEPPVRLRGDMSLDDYRYRRVEVQGEYDVAHQFLLDNQLLGSRAGFHVLTPLRLAGTDAAVLVNRGWIPLGPDRNRLPELPIARPVIAFTGILEAFPRVGFRLVGATVPTPGWPAVVQVLDAEKLSERLGYRVLPYQVLLPAGEGEGFERAWHPADLHPEKNQGYALQWFSFATVLLVVYLWYGFKRQAE